MKQFYSIACNELPGSILKSFCLTATVLMLLSGTAFSQFSESNKQVNIESSTSEEFPGETAGKSYIYPATVQSFLPGTLVNWNVKQEMNKVMLNWTTTIEMNTVHFTIEKSFDGVAYRDAAVLSAAGNSSKRKDYAFSEKLSNNANKIIYYRLKMVDKDANIRYSDVRTIRGNLGEEMKLEIYPNPTTNELKLTVGASWVNEKLLVELYNINGVMVRTKLNQNAKETEVLNVSDLAKGLYFVKITMGTESNVQRFIKN